eukprot:CAMPEP_0117602220 /NCGR_PEP_ID=MMETSP0784-20121206/77456_1 /TAXON_ID=39447 /ORGANISM="" /LENGTH=55 /DNA_ID=CAMNT_0005405007 /DNA_START=121 /DNA_END=288 /DNA_ORIENTATION=-
MQKIATQMLAATALGCHRRAPNAAPSPCDSGELETSLEAELSKCDGRCHSRETCP